MCKFVTFCLSARLIICSVSAVVVLIMIVLRVFIQVGGSEIMVLHHSLCAHFLLLFLYLCGIESESVRESERFKPLKIGSNVLVARKFSSK